MYIAYLRYYIYESIIYNIIFNNIYYIVIITWLFLRPPAELVF